MQTLEGKCIVIGVTGSIAAVETVRLVDELRRKGATVHAVMSSAACGIIGPDALVYATGNPVITRCSGLVEHVSFCGEGGSADLLLVAPCTANTIGKMALGIDDTPVTTFVTTAIGRGMPVLVAPAMHHTMYCHPGVRENLGRLTGWGIGVIAPRIEEGRAKIAGIPEIVLSCERALMGRPLAGKRVLVTSGPCREPVDDIRVLTTRSTGEMGKELALRAFRLGAEVTVVHSGRVPCVRNIAAGSAGEMRAAVLSVCREEGTDYYLSAAAVSDFAPVRKEGKIPSGKPVPLELRPLPKIIDEVVSGYHPVTVAFKLGRDSRERAREMLAPGISLVVADTPEAMGAGEGEFVLVSREGSEVVNGSKEEVAARIWSALL